MNKYEEFMNLRDEMKDQLINLVKTFEETLIQNDKDFMQRIENDIEQYHHTGVLTPSFGNDAEGPLEIPSANRGRERSKQKTDPTIRVPSSSDSSKENEPETNAKQPSTAKRPTRSAFTEATQLANQQSSQSLNAKPHERVNPEAASLVKLERLTDEYKEKSLKVGDPQATMLELKKEAIDMPPPSKPAPKNARKTRGKQSRKASATMNIESVQVKLELINEERKKRTGVSKIANSAKEELEHHRDSDVEIQAVLIDTVILNDTIMEEPERPSKTRARTKNKRKLDSKQKSTGEESEGENKKQRRVEEEPAPIQETARVTRTKTRAAAKIQEAEKQSESSTEDEKERVTLSKSQTKKVKDKELENNVSKHDDVVSDAQVATNSTEENNAKSKQVLNQTMVINKPAALNETVTIEKSTALLNVTTTISAANTQPNEEALMTDDEDVVDFIPVGKRLKKSKPVFSPYEERPVRKRVQAFEKLCATPDLPSKIPSAINKAGAKKMEKANNENVLTNGKGPSNHKEIMHPYMSPVRDQLSSSKGISSSNLSNSTVNSTFMSELKASRSETRVRQLRQKLKETEMSRKQDAMMQAMAEERRRRREERQQRAQQARDAMEREKQKALDSAVRAKEEKLKKVLSEKEDKLQKQREQAAFKRAQAVKKAAEEKLKEDKKKEELKNSAKKAEGKVIPPYLKYETPLLPTADCYDSDDENSKKTHYIRSWEKKPALLPVLQLMRFTHVPKKDLFCNGPQTPNLVEIFPSIESHKLKRTSSAIWDRSAMSKLDTLSEED